MAFNMTPIQRKFDFWFANSKRGDVYPYHRGNLFVDRVGDLHLLCVDLWRLAESGRIHLLQKRHGFEDYEYLAVRRFR